MNMKKIVIGLLAALALSWASAVYAADNGTEFGIEDDLTRHVCRGKFHLHRGLICYGYFQLRGWSRQHIHQGRRSRPGA
ncbi:MAG: hypothetical protein HY796_00735 [Elusimicrobia bacterium]|nr:hypothetical protein [Elusimicrobiota bacterium]